MSGNRVLTLVVDGRPAGRCEIADTYWSRLRGLLGRRRFRGALLLTDCTSVHGAGMTATLDVALLDASMTVLHVRRLPPFGIVLPRRGVTHVLEAHRGAFEEWGVRAGSALEVTGTSV